MDTEQAQETSDFKRDYFRTPAFWLRVGLLSFLQWLAFYVVCGQIAFLSELYGRPLLMSKASIFAIGIPVFLSLTVAICVFEARLRTRVLKKYLVTYFVLFGLALMIFLSKVPHLAR